MRRVIETSISVVCIPDLDAGVKIVAVIIGLKTTC